MECIKFCGAFELALRGHDETEDSDNPGIFRGLIDITAALDSALSQLLESATVFKGTSKTIQNELLDIMYETAKNEIKKEMRPSLLQLYKMIQQMFQAINKMLSSSDI